MVKIRSFSSAVLFAIITTVYFTSVALSAPFKAAFIYFDSVEDGGWSHSHEKGRLALEQQPDIETTFIENVKESFYTTTVLKFLANQKFNLIFTTSLMQVEGALNIAEKYPNITFMLCSGNKIKNNVGVYFGRMYEARFLTGVLAGLKTQSNKIGYSAAFKVPEVIRGLNGFTLGVRSVNPKAQVIVHWTHQWNDGKAITEATHNLIQSGADIISYHQDSPVAQVFAQKNKVYTIGYHDDTTEIVPKYHLVSAVWDWSQLYRHVVKQVQNKTWKPQFLWWGLKEGTVRLSKFGQAVPKWIRSKVESDKNKIIEGKYIFQGPIQDNNGNIKVLKGTNMTDSELNKMDWLVKGVTETEI